MNGWIYNGFDPPQCLFCVSVLNLNILIFSLNYVKWARHLKRCSRWSHVINIKCLLFIFFAKLICLLLYLQYCTVLFLIIVCLLTTTRVGPVQYIYTVAGFLSWWYPLYCYASWRFARINCKQSMKCSLYDSSNMLFLKTGHKEIHRSTIGHLKV